MKIIQMVCMLQITVSLNTEEIIFIFFSYAGPGCDIALMGWMFYFSGTKAIQSDNLSKIVECVHKSSAYTHLL